MSSKLRDVYIAGAGITKWGVYPDKYGYEHASEAIVVFSQAKFRKKSCKNPKFTFRKSEKNRGSFLPHEGMFHAVTFPFKQ